MELIEIFLCIVLLVLCIITSRSDVKEGMIYNKTLLVFAGIAILADGFYYGWLYRNLAGLFLLNVLVTSIISLLLFYSHSFAGGDCKLLMVMALLYPAGCYLDFGTNRLTLYVAIGIGILWGYLYLLGTSAYKLLKKKNSISWNYIKGYLLAFIKSFFSGMIYIGAINLLVCVVSAYGISINVWIIRMLCLCIAWMIGKYRILKKWYVICGVLLFDIILSCLIRVIPVGINPENYFLVVMLLLCQMIIRTNLYEEISIDELKKGMILTTPGSMLMQASRVKGLPGISSETLKDRLTEIEAESVQRWARYRGITTIGIVMKIPFAVFLALGFFSYFIIWRFL